MHIKGVKQFRLFLRELDVLGRRGKPLPSDLLDYVAEYAGRHDLAHRVIPGVSADDGVREKDAAIRALLQRTLRRNE